MLLFSLIACMDEERFWAQYSVQGCKRAEECDAEDFADRYDDQGECQEEVDAMIADGVACFDSCEFSAEDANEELKGFKDAACDNREIDLFEVYACDNELQVSICVAAELLF